MVFPFVERKHISLDLCLLRRQLYPPFNGSAVFLTMQKGDWPMHKLECSAMCAYGEKWNPSETVRLTARILAKQVRPGRKLK